MAGEQRQAEARPGQARFSSSTPPQETVVKQQQLTHALTPVRVRVHATRARMCSGKANGDRIEAEEGDPEEGSPGRTEASSGKVGEAPVVEIDGVVRWPWRKKKRRASSMMLPSLNLVVQTMK